MKKNNLKPSICIVAHNAYGTLANVDTGHVGGVEVQTPLLAKWLANQGYDVSMITWDEGYQDGVIIDGVRVYKMCRRDDGLPLIKFLTPRWSSLWRALGRANPDVVYYNLGDLALGQISLWAKVKKRKLLYSIASDMDCQKDFPALNPLREKILYRYGLLNADSIVVQTSRQKKLLEENFSLGSKLISMPSAGFNADIDIEEKSKTIGQNFRVLWVGRFSNEKRLEWLLEVAKKLKGITFDVIGEANIDSEYGRKLKNEAESIPNVVLHGRIKHNEMADFYRNASILCSTSVYEGFPNVYLEAWSSGVPVITSFDPDGVVDKFQIGSVVNSIDALASEIENYQNSEKWLGLALSSRKYFEDHHQIEKCMSKFAGEFSLLFESH